MRISPARPELRWLVACSEAIDDDPVRDLAGHRDGLAYVAIARPRVIECDEVQLSAGDLTDGSAQVQSGVIAGSPDGADVEQSAHEAVISPPVVIRIPAPGLTPIQQFLQPIEHFDGFPRFHHFAA